MRISDWSSDVCSSDLYPEIVAKTKGPGEDWLVSKRRPGWPLAHRWPTLTVDQRRSAIGQVAARLAAVHSTAPPAGLPPIDDAPQLLPPDPAGMVIARLPDPARLEGGDRMFLHAHPEPRPALR